MDERNIPKVLNLHFEKINVSLEENLEANYLISIIFHFHSDFHNQLWFLALMHTTTKISQNLITKSKEIYSQKHYSENSSQLKFFHSHSFIWPKKRPLNYYCQIYLYLRITNSDVQYLASLWIQYICSRMSMVVLKRQN